MTTMTPEQERQAFAALYHNEDKEILALVHSSYSCLRSGNNLWYTICHLDAWMEDGVLHRWAADDDDPQQKILGSLYWADEENWYLSPAGKPTPHLLPHTIYRLRVRQHRVSPGYFMLLDVLQSDAEDATLQALNDSMRPKVVARWQENPFPVFTLHKTKHDTHLLFAREEKIYLSNVPNEGSELASDFSGEIDWLGSRIKVALSRDEAGKAPEAVAIAILHKLCDAAEAWQARLKDWACAALLESAQEWRAEYYEETEPLTAEAFCQRLRPYYLCCERDGSFSFWFEDRGIFWRIEDGFYRKHSVMVYVRDDDELDFVDFSR